MLRSPTALSLLVITAIPSSAIIFSTTPFSFSSSLTPLDAFPISTFFDATASIPAPEPVYSVVTVTSGYFSMKPSISASHTFSIEVEPAKEIVPSIFLSVSSLSTLCLSMFSSFTFSSSTFFSSCKLETAAALLCDVFPHPAIHPIAIITTLVNPTHFTNFFFIIVLLFN